MCTRIESAGLDFFFKQRSFVSRSIAIYQNQGPLKNVGPVAGTQCSPSDQAGPGQCVKNLSRFTRVNDYNTFCINQFKKVLNKVRFTQK